MKRLSKNRKQKTEKRYLNNFTLLELICVLAIAVLLIGLIIGRVGKTPLFLNLNKCVDGIENVLDEAASQSEINGIAVVMYYRNRTFYFKLPGRNTYRDFQKYTTYVVPEEVDVQFLNQSGTQPEFIFYPDGSASGPGIKLGLGGHVATIEISKITGLPITVIDGQQ